MRKMHKKAFVVPAWMLLVIIAGAVLWYTGALDKLKAPDIGYDISAKPSETLALGGTACIAEREGCMVEDNRGKVSTCLMSDSHIQRHTRL